MTSPETKDHAKECLKNSLDELKEKEKEALGKIKAAEKELQNIQPKIADIEKAMERLSHEQKEK